MSTDNQQPDELDKKLYHLIDHFAEDAYRAYKTEFLQGYIDEMYADLIAWRDSHTERKILAATQAYRRTWMPKTEVEKKVREARIDELKNLPIFTSRRTVTNEDGGVYTDNSECYVTKYELQERLAQLHLQTNIQDNQPKGVIDRSKYPEGTLFCDECGAPYGLQERLNIHKEREHQPKGDV